MALMVKRNSIRIVISACRESFFGEGCRIPNSRLDGAAKHWAQASRHDKIRNRFGSIKNYIRMSIAVLFFLILFVIHPAYSEEKELRILHINDFHGFAEPYKPYGSEEILVGMRDVVIDYIRENKEIEPVVEGRILEME